MKFSDVDQEQWAELSPYLDTCVLPVTGMTGEEQPYEATERLEKLRDMLDLIEIPFKGRTVTYPACHYALEQSLFSDAVDAWCGSLKRAGFRYVVIVTASEALSLKCRNADLQVTPEADGTLPTQESVSKRIVELWNGQASSS